MKAVDLGDRFFVLICLTMKKNTFIFFCALLLASSCKTTRTPTIRLPEQDSVAVVVAQKDSMYLITRLGDTLENLTSEIDIPILRFLPDTISIVGVGDIMMGTNFPDPSYLPMDTGRYLWKAVKPILTNADITFGNLEGTILDQGGEQKECNNPKICYLFRSPEYLATNFQENGFDLMSIANNHANDFGETGRLNTQKVLDSLNIAHAGSIEVPFTIKKIGHLKVGFCAFAPNKGTMSIHHIEKIKEIIQDLDSLSDIVIASFHAGAEGSKHQHITREREYYYGEDRGNVYELAHLMVDNGADVVFGHGPHVGRAIVVYQNKMIAYSLGNFLTYGRFNLKGFAGESPILELKTDSKGNFLTGQIHSFRQSYELGPRVDPNLSSLKTIGRLSLEDFSENPIIITAEGEIRYSEQ